MLYKNILNQIHLVKWLMLISFFYIIISCKNEAKTSFPVLNDNNILKNDCKKDSILYKLPDATINYIVDKLLKNRKLTFCSINIGNYSEGIQPVGLSLYNFEPNQSDSIILHNTNRFLKLRDRRIPILFAEDIFASDKVPIDDSYALCFCTVTLNIKGEIIKKPKNDRLGNMFD